jgi:nicotinate-nucleotide pyrophosphorylase (carboxylating)
MAVNKRLSQVKRTHLFDGALNCKNVAYRNAADSLIAGMLKEDIGSGDVTADLFNGGADRQIVAKIVSNGRAILAGAEELEAFFSVKRDFAKGLVRFEFLKKDGAVLRKGTVFVKLHGFASDILKVERTVLNFLQRLSGVATLTARFKVQVPPRVLITSTRKTLWGVLDKRAVVTGGGGTHRINLSDAVLIKDNHVALFGGDFERILDLAGANRHGRFVEIEVDSPADAVKLMRLYERKIADGMKWPLYILLDNFAPAQIRKTVKIAKEFPAYGNIFLEASGGINLANVKEFARSGVDIISVGALTHSAAAADFSLEF